jgi:REP element-mobilizing transposase RayT
MINLEHGNYYHIYNRGVNRCNLFYTNENYRYFLRQYEKYIDPIADTFAWTLLKNHFHLLIRVKEIEEIDTKRLPVPVKHQATKVPVSLKKPHLYFSDLFNAYAQAINIQEGRTGSLFQRPFQRKEVDTTEYFKQLVVYIHTNAVHHGFVNDFREYPWSSYGTIISLKPSRLQRDKVIGWFNNKGEFIDQHKLELKTELLRDYIIE